MTVVVDLDRDLSVVIEPGDHKPCRFTVVYDDEALVGYETSADPRTEAGTIGLRNVASRHVPAYGKDRIETLLRKGLRRNATAIDEALGPR